MKNKWCWAIVFISLLTAVPSAGAQSCENIKPEVNIIDESGDKEFYSERQKSIDKNLPFKNFINVTSKYIISQLNEMPQCNSQVRLFFVYRPYIYKYQQTIIPFQLERKSSDTKYLDSPWVKLAIGTSSKPYVHAAFIWNERQFLLDQALLSGARSQSTEIPIPIIQQYFYMYSRMYGDVTRDAFKAKVSLDEWQAKNEIPMTLPLDVYWLFRYAEYLSFNLFSKFTDVFNTIDYTVVRTESTYTNLVNFLVNGSFSSGNRLISYKTILDLNGVFPIDKLSIKLK